MSWGYKITILYGGFVLLIASLVTATFFQRSELVTTDYYQQETTFQQRLDAENAARRPGAALQLEHRGDSVLLRFPDELKEGTVSGTIRFYAAAKAAADRNFTLEQLSDQTWTIRTDALERVRYEVQVSWSSAGQRYYQALDLNLLQP